MSIFNRGGASLEAQRLKRLPAMRETWVRSLGREDPLEKGMATHSSILAWRIPWTEEPGRLQSMGSQRVGHDWATSLSFTFMSYIGLPRWLSVKRTHLPVQEMQIWTLGWENLLEKAMATHSSILAWKSHGQRSLVSYSPWGCKRVGHDWVTKQHGLHYLFLL